MLVALVPLTLLGLRASRFGLEDVWQQHLAPPLQHHLHPLHLPNAINSGAREIFHQDSAGLIVFAGLFTIWNVSGLVRAWLRPSLDADLTSRRRP